MRFVLPLSIAAYLGLLPFTAPQGTLRDDARVGTVTDRQGTALVRPALRERWTPLATRSVLVPGDQVRTPKRGANAVEIRLAGGGALVLGPGSLVELPERGIVRLYGGDLEAKGEAGHPVEIRGPGGFTAKSQGEALVLRASDRATEKLTQAPRWLVGYRASTTDEWMGSLVATVDGRDTPLTIGYHKVTVDVRDQIARTTVEQSFRNTTDGTLEGVFYFPLPADASISGFGMWIGDELVEADIVEKQKARRIYEDILRRKKDPGLLEWSGGNLFKARVFPIFPHSEKRIRIRYTQILPLEGSKLRYRYALRSDLLRRNPLRELRIDVKVASLVPIKEVASPTHEVRVRRTATSASAEFAAEEYSPSRDFELAIELERPQPLTVVPHRRGEDGYFMLLLAPPDDGSGWQRELTPEKGALDLVVVADTSASMDPAARTAQAGFVGSLLSLLGPKDRFRLLTCDIDARPWRDEPTPVTSEHVEAALAFLEERASLGWTDLDKAFAEVGKLVQKGTIVVYVGDGIGTTGDADPVALAQRLKAQEATTTGVFHAVFASSTYEKGVLEAIASLGGGSVRGMDEDPAQTAYALLKEAAQPAIKDLRVSFQDLRTARVYPEVLPNLPQGTQQIVLGRFLPQGAAQRGKVIVEGNLAGKPVRFATELALAENDEGNSFVPRLWARRHIDALLAQGRSKALMEEIVGFSEEFGIMTPYTSFLVLESDEDRERYGVTRRVHMRDGERFFAEGRDQATTELMREQMKVARGWRLDLRRRMLLELAGLGRELHVAVATDTGRVERLGENLHFGAPTAGGGGGAYRGPGDLLPATATPSRQAGWDGSEAENEEPEAVLAPRSEETASEDRAADDAVDDFGEADGKLEELGKELKEGLVHEYSRRKAPVGGPRTPGPAGRSLDGYLGDFDVDKNGLRELAGKRGYRLPAPSPFSFANYRFPALAPAPKPPAARPDPEWPAALLALLHSLDRRDALAGFDGGVELLVAAQGLHPMRGHRTSYREARGLQGKAGWFVREESRGSEPVEQWLIDGKRGVLAAGLRLGRTREAAALDSRAWPFPLSDWSLTDLVEVYREWQASVAESGDLATITLKAPAPSTQEQILVIDRAKHVVVEHRTRTDGKVRSIWRLGDFVEVGGVWWARRIEQLDDEGRVVLREDLTVNALSPAQLTEALQAATADHGDAILVGAQDPLLGAAKQAAHEGKASFADQFRIAVHYASSQQWDKVWAAFDAAAPLVSGKPGEAWLRAMLRGQSRRGDELRQQLLARAAEVATQTGPATPFLARYLFELAQGSLAANEQLGLLETLRPALERAGPDADWQRLDYQRQRARLLAAVQRPAESRAIYGAIYEQRPFDHQAVRDWMGILAGAGEHDAAIAVVRQAVAEQKWTEGELDALYQDWTDTLWNRRDLPALSEVLAAWIARDPKQDDPWLRWLSVQLFRHQEDAADAWVATELARTLPERLEDAPLARLAAATRFALGDGWNIHGNRIDERWWQPLAELARRLMTRERDARGLAARILGDWRFRRTDAYAGVRTALLVDLTAENAIETMPLERLVTYLNLLPWGRNEVDEKVWRDVVERLTARWRATRSGGKEKQHERSTLARYVLQLLDGWQEKAAAIALLRSEVADADAEARPALVRQLMDRLVQEKWAAEIEAELFTLEPQTQPKEVWPTMDEETARKQVASDVVHRLAEDLYRMRYQALLGEPKDYEGLARDALRLKQREARAGARKALAAAFGERRKSASRWAAPWYELERLCLAAQLGEDLAALDGEGRELFASTPKDRQHFPDQILRERIAIVLAFAATRRQAPAGLADAVVGWLEPLAREAMAARNETPDPELARRIDWQYHLLRLLVALDRPEPLAKTLSGWIVPAEVQSRWRIALAYLRAELGQLTEAVAQLEAVATANELGARDYQALADWLLVLGDEARREKALLGRYEVSSEWELSRKIRNERSRVGPGGPGGGVPEELDPDVLRALRVLLGKASRPENYLWQVQNLYRGVKDFRLLESLPYGVLGHSAEATYGFLQRVAQVIGEIHEEATCDQLNQRIAELSASATRTTDRRALLLLSAFVERRAGEVLNQPGPHAERGLAALRQAFEHEWAAGEPLLMAGLLASLGRIPQAAFADEQRLELRELHARADRGSYVRLLMALHLHRTDWAYRDHQRAIDGLLAALDEYRTAQQGILPNNANEALQTAVTWLQERRHYGKSEELLKQELAVQSERSQQDWLRQWLFQVWINALGEGGAVAFGRGAQLYDAARTEIERTMWTGNPESIATVLGKLCALHQTAHRKAKLAAAARELAAFARDRFPELVDLVPGSGTSFQRTVAQTMHEVLGARAALAFLIECIEKEPRWWSRVGRGGWQTHGWSLAQWRAEAGDLGDLEPRLLRIVLAEIERDLVSLDARSRAMYQRGHTHFWHAKREDFARVALKVIELHADSAARQIYAAQYLWNGLDMPGRAIDALMAAETRGVLPEEGRSQLTQWLQDDKVRRFADSLPLLDKLLATRPDNLGYRGMRIRALHEVGRDPEAIGFLDETLRLLKDQNRWNEPAIAQVASVCRVCRFAERGANLYEELIPLHQRTHGNRGVGGGTLSRYYTELSECYSELGNADKAVDAASAAVVAWGPTHQNRKAALQGLYNVLRRVGDLDAYAARYEARVRETGLDAPLIRKMIAKVYLARREAAKAIPHLIAARELQPDDEEIHRDLLDAHDRLGDKAAACASLRQSIRIAPLNLDLYAELGKRLGDLGDTVGTERAWTSLVEVKPNEAEPHRRLAEYREKAGSWPAAVVQWQQVVRCRAEEPDGWLALATAQIKAGTRDAARRTIDHLLETKWEERFGDVRSRAARLLQELGG